MSDITKDQGVNALRRLRQQIEENLFIAGHELLDKRETIKRQAAHIAKLKEELDTSDMAIESLHEMCDTHEAENSELKRLNSVMFLRLEAHAKARYHGVEITNRQAEFMTHHMIDNAPDIRGFLGPEIMVMLESRRTKRLNRIATGIKNRINDGHTTLAIIMCETLMEETIDGHANDGDSSNNIGTRSNGDTKTTRSLGTPYIGE